MSWSEWVMILGFICFGYAMDKRNREVTKALELQWEEKKKLEERLMEAIRGLGRRVNELEQQSSKHSLDQ